MEARRRVGPWMPVWAGGLGRETRLEGSAVASRRFRDAPLVVTSGPTLLPQPEPGRTSMESAIGVRGIMLSALAIAAMTADANAQKPAAAAGPLVVSAANPRYFTIASGNARRAVYLTGS